MQSLLPMQSHHIIIFDLEFTAWPGSNKRKWSEAWEFREIIQIAAVKLQITEDAAEIVSTFNELVKPKINPRLSDYIVQLTGISQSTIDEMAVDFKSALDQFYSFSQDGKVPCFAWGNDDQVLYENCQIQEFSMPVFSAGFVNLQRIAATLGLSGHHLASGEVANYLGAQIAGHKHNALFDVRSLAVSLNHWLAKGQLTPSQLSSSELS